LGICHRDLSLENILVHQGQCLIIDMGMCLRVPQRDDGNTNELEDVRDATQYHHDTNNNEKQQQSYSNWKKRQKNHKRFLLKPQGVCRKFKYMSPEIKQNEVPFDGYAVDMWSVGVMLFMMCTGYEPWEIPCDTDTQFYYFTRGYLADMIAKQQGIKLSDELLDLLQWMMVVNPRERPCLSQVCAHPWMKMGQYKQ
jgi:serine/threonine protein kinase